MTGKRALAFIAIGAAAFAWSPALVSRFQPPVVIDFSADPPAQITAGFYPVEHTPEGTWFAWTQGAFGLALPTLDRSTPWTLTLRLSGSRPDGTRPDLVTNIDGTIRDRSALPDAGYVDRTWIIPALPGGGRGVAVVWNVTPTFVPGGGDARVLGAQIDTLTLTPAGPGPRAAIEIKPLVIAGVASGAAMAVLALPGLAGSALLVLLALAVAFILTRGLAPFVAIPWLWIALGTFASAVVTLAALPARTTGGRVVVAVTYVTVAIQLLLLAHPNMPIGDAIFHTHRFQDVLGGHYLFASLAPGNYRFPYPIGLYLFAKPFAAFAPTEGDRMMLLRVVVVAVDACAAALLYRLVNRWRQNELEAVGSVVAYHLLPLGFGVIVTANLTNMFGQSLAMIALVATGLVIANRSERAAGGASGVAWPGALLVGALAAAAFLSHTSTFAVLGAQLTMAGLALAVARDRAWRPAGRTVLVAAMGAIVFAIAVYYAYFMDVYREAFTRIASETGHATAAAGGRTPLTRLIDLPRGLLITFGAPGLLLAAVGTIAIVRERRPSPIRTLLAVWLAACVLFMIVGIITPVDLRHLLAALPVMGIVVAVGFGALWRAGMAGRTAGVILAGWMFWVAAISWTGMLGGR